MRAAIGWEVDGVSGREKLIARAADDGEKEQWAGEADSAEGPGFRARLHTAVIIETGPDSFARLHWLEDVQRSGSRTSRGQRDERSCNQGA